MTERKILKRNKLRKKIVRKRNILHADIKRIVNGNQKGLSVHPKKKSQKFKKSPKKQDASN